jgi:catechol 2,3-dioxygenase
VRARRRRGTPGSTTSRCATQGAQELGRAVAHLLASGYPVTGAQDHGGTVSVYLRDPDGKGIELYYDRPREYWVDAEGRPVLRNDPIPLAEIVSPTGSS